MRVCCAILLVAAGLVGCAPTSPTVGSKVQAPSRPTLAPTTQAVPPKGKPLHPFHGDRINRAKEMTNDPFWIRAREEAYRSPDELVAQAAQESAHGQRFSILRRGNPTRRQVALTFDDGPHPDRTLKLLKILKDSGIKATFFVIGKMVEAHPELLRAIAADGHTVGNHTFSHVTLTKIPLADIETEYGACSDIIEATLGKPPIYCRPPGGDYDRLVIQASERLALRTVLWTDDPGDYAQPGDTVIMTRAMNRVSNGGILLFHDGVVETLDILPQLIKGLKAKGFSFVTLDRL